MCDTNAGLERTDVGESFPTQLNDPSINVCQILFVYQGGAENNTK